jgi:hypothetical protein
MLVRAIAIVLMTVLDVDAVTLVIEPVFEFDLPAPDGREGRELPNELVLNRRPMEVHVVVPTNDDECVARRHELGERLENDAVTPGHAAKLVDRVFLGVAETEDGVVGIEHRLFDVSRRRNAHPDEIDEISCDDESPRAPLAGMLPVEVEQRSELPVAVVRRVRTRRRIRLGVMNQIAPQMNVGEYE